MRSPMIYLFYGLDEPYKVDLTFKNYFCASLKKKKETIRLYGWISLCGICNCLSNFCAQI